MGSKPDGGGFKRAWESACPNSVSPTPSRIYLSGKAEKVQYLKVKVGLKEGFCF